MRISHAVRNRDGSSNGRIGIGREAPGPILSIANGRPSAHVPANYSSPRSEIPCPEPAAAFEWRSHHQRVGDRESWRTSIPFATLFAESALPIDRRLPNPSFLQHCARQYRGLVFLSTRWPAKILLNGPRG